MPSHITLLSLLAVFVTVATSQTCYGLDGAQLDDTFAPCKPTAKHSGCCATKRSTDADICLDSGLCMYTRTELMGMIWQNGCTDATGKDAACPKICPDRNSSPAGLIPVPSWNVQQCDYGSYCCRAPNDRKSCCDNPTAPKVTLSSIGAFQSQPAMTVTPSATPQPTQVVASAVSTGTPFAAAAAPASDTCKKERHQTAVVGGTIGGLFGAIIVGLLGVTFWMYRQEKRQRKMKEHYEEQFAQTTSYRRTIASSAISLMGSELSDIKTKTAGV